MINTTRSQKPFPVFRSPIWGDVLLATLIRQTEGYGLVIRQQGANFSIDLSYRWFHRKTSASWPTNNRQHCRAAMLLPMSNTRIPSRALFITVPRLSILPLFYSFPMVRNPNNSSSLPHPPITHGWTPRGKYVRSPKRNFVGRSSGPCVHSAPPGEWFRLDCLFP